MDHHQHDDRAVVVLNGGREGKVLKDAQHRRCFHCGLLGHMAANCSAKGETRCPEGHAAFQAFVDGGSQLQDRMPQRYYSLYHYYKLQQWVQQQQQHTQANAVVVDPISLAFSVLSESSVSNHNPEIRCLRKNLFHSYRELFDQLIQKLEVRYRERIDCRLGNDTITEDDHEDDSINAVQTAGQTSSSLSWQSILTQAVKDGTPANFSDPHALRAYTLEKLIPRCRQLHHLILDHNNLYAEKIRAVLLRRCCTNHTTMQQHQEDHHPNAITSRSKQTTLSVFSIGGGPGYDHIAICMVTKFLHDMLLTVSPKMRHSDQPPVQSWHIHTRVFDLWDQHWKPITDELMQSWNDITESSSSSSSFVTNTTTTSMHHADLRLSLDASTNHELSNAIPLADLIVFQYVLHENASCLLEDVLGQDLATSTTRLQLVPPATTITTTNTTNTNTTTTVSPLRLRQNSALVDILRCAKVGAIIVCTDSVHTLWPVIQETATMFGWTYMSDAERNHNIVMGPNSFLVLERARLQ